MFCKLHILIYPQNAIREPIRNHPQTVLGFGIWELDPVFGHRYAFGYSFLVARAQNPSTSTLPNPASGLEAYPIARVWKSLDGRLHIHSDYQNCLNLRNI